jgi:large subunit ribosomal protein L18
VKTSYRTLARLRRHVRVRKRVHGSTGRPRFCIFRSLRAVYAQIVDDDRGVTLVQANSREPGVRPAEGSIANTAAALAVGKAIGERAKAAGITQVVFDRGGYLYHGRVKAAAEGAREAGLQF